MKLIKAEDIDIYYVFPEDDFIKEEAALFKTNIIANGSIWSNRAMPRSGDYPLELYDKLQNGDNTRLVICKLKPQLKGYPEFIYRSCCLIWPKNDIDLKKLDQKVKNDTFKDEDFNTSLIAYVQIALCRYCHDKYIALFTDYDMYFSLRDNLTGLDLFKEKKPVLEIGKCPNCNETLGIYIPKFLYKIKDKEFI